VPELPQMQALAERLDAVLTGHVLAAVDALGFSALKTVTPAPESLVGHAVQRIGRRAKYLVLEFGDAGRHVGPQRAASAVGINVVLQSVALDAPLRLPDRKTVRCRQLPIENRAEGEED